MSKLQSIRIVPADNGWYLLVDRLEGEEEKPKGRGKVFTEQNGGKEAMLRAVADLVNGVEGARP